MEDCIETLQPGMRNVAKKVAKATREISPNRALQIPKGESERTRETEVWQADTPNPNPGAASVATMTLEKGREREMH